MKNPQPCGADEGVPVPTDRRGVSRHAKPLFPAAAPMERVIAGMAPERRLLFKFACGCGSANERKPHKSAPAQRQRKEDSSVLLR